MALWGENRTVERASGGSILNAYIRSSWIILDNQEYFNSTYDHIPSTLMTSDFVFLFQPMSRRPASCHPGQWTMPSGRQTSNAKRETGRRRGPHVETVLLNHISTNHPTLALSWVGPRTPNREKQYVGSFNRGAILPKRSLEQ